MSRDDLRPIVKQFIKSIENQWRNDVSAIQYRIVDTRRANIFIIEMEIFGKFNIKMEYENSTLGISVKQDNMFVGLSKLTNEKVYIGFDSCEPENIQHNFEVLDRTLCKMMKNT